MITYWAGHGKYRVSCRLFAVEEGLVAHLFGGEKPHVGAVALAIPRPSLRQKGKISATASVLAVVGHKDDELARPTALLLAARCRVPVVVIAGVHVEGAGPQDISMLVSNARRAVKGVLRVWQTVSPGRRTSG